jgi:hypothetical protein
MKNRNYVYDSGNLKRKSLKRLWYRWEDSIQMDLKEIMWGHDSAGSGYVPVVNYCDLSNEPFVFINGEELINQLNENKILVNAAPCRLYLCV